MIRLSRPRLPSRGGWACVGLGALAALGFAPLDLWPLTLIGVAGWMALVAAAPSCRSGFLRGWAFGLGHFTIGNAWIATAFTYQAAMPAWLGWIAVVLLAIYLAVYPAFAALASRSWGRGGTIGSVLVFAAAWIVTEYARATVFTGFAWNPLGVALLPASLPLARSAMWIGTYGLSGLMILAAGGLVLASRRHWYGAGGIGVVLVAIGLVGLLPHAIIVAPARQIDVVQPNIGQDHKWDAADAPRNYARLAGLSRRASLAPRLLLWPEAAVPDYLEEEPYARQRLARLLRPGDLMLTGGTALEYDRRGELVGARNSAFVMGARARLLGRYDKAHLVPYGEYLPMRPVLSAIGLSRLAPGDLDFWPGPGARTLALPGFGSVGLQICYEIIFSGRVVDAAHRPDFIFNPSNDAWFGPSGRRSIWRRRGCARSRRGCRSSARRPPASPR